MITEKEKDLIKVYIGVSASYKYLIRNESDRVFAYSDSGIYMETLKLAHLCPNKNEKVYLQDLLNEEVEIK